MYSRKITKKTQQEAERYFQLCLFDAVNLCGCLVGKRSPCDDVLHLAPFLLHIRYKRNLCPRMLCDGSKFGKIAQVTFAELADVTVITAGLKDKKYKKYENIVEVEGV